MFELVAVKKVSAASTVYSTGHSGKTVHVDVNSIAAVIPSVNGVDVIVLHSGVVIEAEHDQAQYDALIVEIDTVKAYGTAIA